MTNAPQRMLAQRRLALVTERTRLRPGARTPTTDDAALETLLTHILGILSAYINHHQGDRQGASRRSH
jgi:hypothetical protein